MSIERRIDQLERKSGMAEKPVLIIWRDEDETEADAYRRRFGCEMPPASELKSNIIFVGWQTQQELSLPHGKET